jgi:hypothetical protein
MNVCEFEDFLVFHQNEVGAATELDIEVQTPDGAPITLAVVDLTVANDRLVIHAVQLPG